MANLNIDANAWPTFILRWIFAGVWGALGWALSVKFVIPLIPGM